MENKICLIFVAMVMIVEMIIITVIFDQNVIFLNGNI